MTGNEYQKLAERTMDFKNLTPAELEMHALHGMVGEIGELHSIYQKVYQGHHFDDGHAMKEVVNLVAEFSNITQYKKAMCKTLWDQELLLVFCS